MPVQAPQQEPLLDKETNSTLMPTEINLHQKSRLLEIGFSDGFAFKFPCEYLRVFSTSAENKVREKPEHGKETVNISRIEPQGTYALRLYFDDGHDTGIYSWGTLHELGVNYEKNWQDYLSRLKKYNLARGEGRALGADGKATIKILYFIQLAKISGKLWPKKRLSPNIRQVFSTPIKSLPMINA